MAQRRGSRSVHLGKVREGFSEEGTARSNLQRRAICQGRSGVMECPKRGLAAGTMVVVVVVVCPEKPPRGWGASWTREKHGTMVTVVDGVLIFFFPSK